MTNAKPLAEKPLSKQDLANARSQFNRTRAALEPFLGIADILDAAGRAMTLVDAINVRQDELNKELDALKDDVLAERVRRDSERANHARQLELQLEIITKETAVKREEANATLSRTQTAITTAKAELSKLDAERAAKRSALNSEIEDYERRLADLRSELAKFKALARETAG